MDFETREQAGAILASALQAYADKKPIVYALPRGGLPVAAVVAASLKAPLDLILVQKIGAPGHAELAIGAVVDGAAPTVILHNDSIEELGIGADYINTARVNALREIERRRALYLHDQQPISATGRTAIIIDDGLATGATMEAAATAIRKSGPDQLIIAAPVAPSETLDRLRKIADEVVCIETPTPFWSVGGQYRSFPQLSDNDVIEILARFNSQSVVNADLGNQERNTA